MDLTLLVVDAGQFINRAVQYTGESLGQADRTQLDPGLEELLAQVDATKTWTDNIISQTEVLLQPSLGARLEDRLYEHLEWSIPPRPRANELLGDQMTQAGLEIGSNTPYGMALIRCGEAQKQLGDAERKFVKSTNIHFLTPLRSFTEGEHRVMQNERKMLVNKRLDLDIAKNRLRKAQEADREARYLNSSPLDDDYMSHVSYMFSFLRVKWLKVWAQEISQAEMELRICQSLYDRQSEMTRRVAEGISNTHTNHMRSLTDFVDAQSLYFAQCNQHAQELLRQIGRIPAVLCSNNWQSAVNNEVNLPVSSGCVAAEEPLELDQVAPAQKNLHQHPDDKGISSPPKTKSSSSLPALCTVNNNNNNSISTQREVNQDRSAIRRQLFASQTFDHVFKSNQTDDMCVTTNRLFAAASASAETVSVSVNDDAAEGTTKAASSTSQANTVSNQSQLGDLEANVASTLTDPPLNKES